MSTALLEVKNLIKTYGDLSAVDDISFRIDSGLCFGLLGPNGAGKTTALEVIEDIREGDSGEILYKGKKRSGLFREEVGIQFQSTELLNLLTVRETLETFRGLYAETGKMEDLIRLCHLDDIQDNRNDRLSGGQKQRLLLAVALVNNPELLFLDEPSTGMDPQARRNMWDIILAIKNKGKTVVLTTHYMEEAEYLCDEIVIMDHGRIIAQGSPEHLIRTNCGGATIVLPVSALGGRSLPRDFMVTEVNGSVEIHTSNINSCIKDLFSLGLDLNDMTVRSPNLEDVFLKLTGRKLRE